MDILWGIADELMGVLSNISLAVLFRNTKQFLCELLNVGIFKILGQEC